MPKFINSVVSQHLFLFQKIVYIKFTKEDHLFSKMSTLHHSLLTNANTTLSFVQKGLRLACLCTSNITSYS